MTRRQHGIWRGRALGVVNRLEHALLWPLGFAAVLALSAVLAFGLIDQLDDQQTAIMRSAGIEQEVQQLLQLTVDVETATRGYVIAGDPVFLAPANRALPGIDAGLARLSTLTADSPAVALSLRELDTAIRQRIRHEQDNQANAAGGRPLLPEQMLESKRMQDRIRAAIAQVVAHERALRQRGMARSARARAALKATIVMSALVLGLLGWLWFRARRRLLRTQDNYRSLFSSAANGIAVVGPDGRIVQANASYAAMLGYAQGELVGEDFVLLKHPDERGHARQALHTLFESDQEVLRNERRYLRRDGTEMWVRSTMSRTRETATGSLQLLVIAEDVSERIRNEELLRRSAVLLQNAGRTAAIDGWFLALPSGALQLGAHLKQALRLDADRPGALLERLSARSRRVLLRAVSSCRHAGRAFDIELETNSASTPLVLRVMGQPALGPYGLSGIDGAVQDITEAKRIQRKLRKSELRFRAAAQVTNDGIWDLDVAAGTIWRSPSISALVGMDVLELEDSPVTWQRLVHPDDRAMVLSGFERALQGSAEEFHAEYRVRRADGSYAYVLDKACTVRDDSGAVVRMVGGIRDLSERRRSQQALMGMAASVPNGDSAGFFLTLLAHLLEAIGADGGAIARPDEEQPSRMRTVAALVDGVSQGALDYALVGSPCAQLDALAEYIVPAGLAQVCPDAGGLPGLKGAAYAGRNLIATDGRPLGVIFAVFREPIAEPDVMAPVLRVFAARAGAELERLDGAARLVEQAALLDQAREAIVVLGLDLKVRFWNRGAELMYGKPPHQMLGCPVLSCYKEQQAARAARSVVLETGEWRGESVQQRCDGGELTVDESWTLVRNAQGEPHSILKVGSDVTEKRAAEEQIRRLAYHDTLTGLPNRRLFMDRLRQLRLRNVRQRRCGALLFIDMDNFKSLNDQHGHDAGDEFLRQTATRLRACVRADDTVARLGGDEFVVLLDNLDADAQAAIRAARRVGASIVDAFRQPVQIGAFAHLSTASVGVVLVRDTQEADDDLLQLADQAMYRAKHGGRNAVEVASQNDNDEPLPLATT